MTCGIYKITNEINGKCYIGQSCDIERRWSGHIHAAKYNIENNKFYNSINKHRICNFSLDIIKICKKEELNYFECFYIMIYDSISNGLNSSSGGIKPIYCKETCDKLSISKLGNQHFKGKTHTEETKVRMSKNNGRGKKSFVIDGIKYESIIEYGRNHNLLKNRAKRELVKLGIL